MTTLLAGSPESGTEGHALRRGREAKAARVLVTDGFWRKSLSAVRALGASREFEVTAGEWSRFSCSLFSRFARKTIVYPSPLSRPKAFLRALSAEIRRDSVDILMPMEETTLITVLRARDTHFKGVLIPFAPLERILVARDKAIVLRKAMDLGIPVPRTLFSEDVSPRSLASFPLPALVKPRISSGARGIRYAAKHSELEAAYHEVASRFPRPLVQERLPSDGRGAGVSMLIDFDGRVLASFTHLRLRENPPKGGASTLRASARIPEIEECAASLVRCLGLSGVAMVEFKTDLRDGRFKLMEVNPRFWGSLELAVRAGVNFPVLLARWAQGRFHGPPPGYREGVMCRWLIPGDILHFIRNPERFRLDPPFFRFRMKDLHYDIIRRGDMMPVLGTVLSAFPMASSDMKKFLRP